MKSLLISILCIAILSLGTIFIFGESPGGTAVPVSANSYLVNQTKSRTATTPAIFSESPGFRTAGFSLEQARTPITTGTWEIRYRSEGEQYSAYFTAEGVDDALDQYRAEYWPDYEIVQVANISFVSCLDDY